MHSYYQHSLIIPFFMQWCIFDAHLAWYNAKKSVSTKQKCKVVLKTAKRGQGCGRPFQKVAAVFKTKEYIKEFACALGIYSEFSETWRVDMEWVWNLVLRSIMLSGKEKVLLMILNNVHHLRNILWSQVVGRPRIYAGGHYKKPTNPWPSIGTDLAG